MLEDNYLLAIQERVFTRYGNTTDVPSWTVFLDVAVMEICDFLVTEKIDPWALMSSWEVFRKRNPGAAQKFHAIHSRKSE